MALTLRPNDEQQKVLEQSQQLVGENTITKAIYKALSEYIQLRQQHEQLKQEHKRVCQKLELYEETVSDYQDSLERLAKLS